jgi:hypothetical protein
MWAQLTPVIKRQGRRLVLTLTLLSLLFGRAILRAWKVVRPPLVFALNVLAAVILLFEEWGWKPLSNLVAKLARFPVWAALERWIAGLPPYGALVTLAVPSAILIPAKFLGVFLLVTGHFVTAVAMIIAAKLASTALIARIFVLTKPQLLQIPWFRSFYEAFVPWQESLFAHIRNSWAWRYGRVLRWRTNHYVHRTYATLRPQLDDLWHDWRPRVDGIGHDWIPRAGSVSRDWKPRALATLQRARAAVRAAGERTTAAGERALRRAQARMRGMSERAGDKGERLLRRLQGL